MLMFICVFLILFRIVDLNQRCFCISIGTCLCICIQICNWICNCLLIFFLRGGGAKLSWWKVWPCSNIWMSNDLSIWIPAPVAPSYSLWIYLFFPLLPMYLFLSTWMYLFLPLNTFVFLLVAFQLVWATFRGHNQWLSVHLRACQNL